MTDVGGELYSYPQIFYGLEEMEERMGVVGEQENVAEEETRKTSKLNGKNESGRELEDEFMEVQLFRCEVSVGG